MTKTPPLALAGAFLVLLALVGLGAFMTGDKDLVHNLGQGLLTIAGMVASYYFGSSQGSAKKDETIAAALTPPSPDQPGEPQ
jgi:uncharacterized RDD family membrane protein YckC